MAKPAAFSDSMPSAGGTSIQSTWPERSAASRVFASGIGISTTLSTFAFRAGIPIADPSAPDQPPAAARFW